MTPRTPADTLALTTAALLHDHDVTDLLYSIVRDSARFTGSDAAGLLVRTAGGALELLSATSHAAVELELYQAQVDEGPCVDVLRQGEPVAAVGADAIRRRWPTVGAAIVQAGFSAVHAYPLNWRDGALGGLNLFRHPARADDAEQTATARSFADMAALVLVQPERLEHDDVATGLAHALDGRVIIEQAKGVLAQQLDVDMETAYTALVDLAAQNAIPLSSMAYAVVHQAYRR
ncbi:GAF and ANTAR domain-containing protein [Promicromonospora panici]|uniref:GAF and ANTAR domain-containing protein n=1 Tax=Promicromonospora panici TaxID=2219658 RepID=UPI00101D307E|nr:GAF and ANTAR domain-containing protein [Promicromonospora panici]